MATQIMLIRHGETEWSITGQHTGRTDLPLTANGERLASLLREPLKAKGFSHVLTSPLKRAHRTCELAGFGGVAQIDPLLQEWDYGAYEGLTTKEIRAQHPQWNVFQDGAPRGESVEQISERADQIIASLRELEGTVAIFSHGHFLRALAVRWIGLPIIHGRHFSLETGAMCILGHENATPVVSLWNGVALR
ncbi:MAG TPA: histidine phosphatase family protein [Rariglobus sp.]|jgi:probable phosphoglycerate mutase|nr:histidine phosphatase family protein [Rariglobus sp.]